MRQKMGLGSEREPMAMLTSYNTMPGDVNKATLLIHSMASWTDRFKAI